MAFRTKLDYSDNRQINQRQRTFTNLEGGSVFGVAYSAMTTGVDPTCITSTEEYVFTGSTFSGNGTTTMYTWFDQRMEIAAYTLSALTSSNSGETQNTGNVFVIDTTATTVDGYTYTLTYTGTSFDVFVDTMYSGAGPVFTGTVSHDFVEFLSACSLDYSGTTLWFDNPEKTRTKRLVITENATPNYVWTCVNADGLGGWLPSSGGTTGSTDTFVTGGTLNGTNLDLTWNTGGSVPSIDLSPLSASTNFANTDLTLTGDRVHDLSGYTVTLKDEKDDQTRLIVENLFNGGSANSAVSVRSRGAGAVTISGTILYGGDSFNGYGSFTDGGSGLLTNAFSMTSLGGTPSQRGNINIGSRRGTDAEVRIFNGGDDFDFTSLGAKFTTTGFTSYQDVYIDNLPSESVLGTDANGKIIAGTGGGGAFTSTTANNRIIPTNTLSNSVSSDNSSILGGDSNTINTNSGRSIIVGGRGNGVEGEYSFIGNGLGNSISGRGFWNTIINGDNNDLSLDPSSNYNTVVGNSHSITGTSLVANSILGGQNNSIHTRGGSNPINSSIMGGSNNTVYGPDNVVIIGGEGNLIDIIPDRAVIAGGENNNISGESDDSFIGGGVGNIIDTSGFRNSIVGGQNNSIEGSISNSVILGGQNITGTTDDTVYVPNLNIDTLGVGTSVNNLGIDSSGNVVTGTTGSSPWTAGTANNTAALIGYTGLTNNPDTAYFEHGVTDMISGSTFSGNTIDMNSSVNNGITIQHNDGGTDTEYLQLDTTVQLSRNSSNRLTINNGISDLKAYDTLYLEVNGVRTFSANRVGGNYHKAKNIGSAGSIQVFQSALQGGSPILASTIHDGELQGEIVMGIPRAGIFDYDGVFGTGLGNQTTGATGREYQPIFISTPRAQARDNTSYSSIINSVFVGGSDNTMLTGVTGSVIVGGTGHTIDSGVIRTVVLGGIDISATTSDMVYVPDLVIDGLNSTDPLATDANGKIIAGASDARLKTNINNLESALDKVLNLRGVSYEWTEESNMGAGITKYGLIAQEVQKVIPDMVRLRAKADDTLTLSYTEIVPWLIEAVKELASDDSPLIKREELILETQTISSEDNNIELNFNGNHGSALNGGIKVVKGVNETTNSEFKINSDGDWVTNNYIKPFGLTLPRFTPESTNDKKGKLGEVTRDNDYIYIKSESGWKRTSLETF